MIDAAFVKLQHLHRTLPLPMHPPTGLEQPIIEHWVPDIERELDPRRAVRILLWELNCEREGGKCVGSSKGEERVMLGNGRC